MRRVNPPSAVAAVILCLAGCKGSTPVTPPPVNNTPPTIESLAIGSARVEADREVQVTASVSDAETPVGQLTYTWSASPSSGTFTGSGATAMWRPPKGQTSPQQYTVTLTVTESYTSAGQARQNVVSRNATVLYHDSPAETTALAAQFLTDYGTYSTTPEYCVRNFSNNCRGKEEERQQIADDRAEVFIFSAAFKGTPAVFLNATLTGGSVEGPCEFVDMDRFGPDANKKRSVNGTCVLTTVYENGRWYLCESFFRPPYETIYLNLRHRHRFRLPAD
jgi:hypothetical protein